MKNAAILLSVYLGASTVVYGGCSDSPSAPVSSADLELESSTVYSGSEGILVSPAFETFALTAAVDTAGASIPRRWSNLRVRFGGQEVDSWRIDETRIAFRVPPSYSGDYEIQVESPLTFERFPNASVVGARPGHSPGWNCYSMTPQVPMAVSPGELLLATHCNQLDFETERVGTVRLFPATTFQSESLVPVENPYWCNNDPVNCEPVTGAGDWLAELSFQGDWSDLQPSWRFMWAAGPSYRPGFAVVERYPSLLADSSSTWVWRFGSDPEPVTAIDCVPTDYGWGSRHTSFIAAELAPGLCAALNRDGLYVGGVNESALESFSDITSWPSFKVASDGTAVLTDVYPLEADFGWPVVRPGEGIAYMLTDYRAVYGVAFSAEGDSMYVTGHPSTSSRDVPSDPVLDLRDARTGTLLLRTALDSTTHYRFGHTIPTDVHRSGEQLWTARYVLVDGREQYRVEIRDPEDLSILRAVAVPEYEGGLRSLVPAGDDAIVMPDETGQGTYLVTWGTRSDPELILVYVLDLP
jgi:hypothetical protein